ncbi:MAG TPA: selenium metabolism-associated LysR family transcriptional regulator [Thermoanaerobaculia bacterium]|nr:selenium metabolism-associated LysR family transcriptional regulator [Thermoanaerobaculia bacterium]
MNLRALEAFRAVYEEGGFTAAARRLGLSQPTVSSHVQSLEEELGSPLFDRLGRQVSPTRAAHVLHRHARRLLDLAGEMAEEMDRFLHGLQGHLQMGASTIPGEYWLPARIGRFHALHPEIEVTLEIHDTRAVLDRVQDGRVELGVVGARMEDGDLEFRELAVDGLALVASAHRPDGRREITADELRQIPFVLREPGSGTRHMLEGALSGLGVSLRDLRVVAELGSTTAVKEAIKAGMGVSVLSRLAVRADLETGLLREITVRGLQDMERSLFAVVHAERALSPLSQVFLEFLAGEAAASPADP